jgi:hypothetical protein
MADQRGIDADVRLSAVDVADLLGHREHECFHEPAQRRARAGPERARHRGALPLDAGRV